MDVAIRHLTTEDEVRVLKPLLQEYIAFVSGKIRREYGVDIPDKEELARTMDHLDRVIPPKGHCFAAFYHAQPAGMVRHFR